MPFQTSLKALQNILKIEKIYLLDFLLKKFYITCTGENEKMPYYCEKCYTVNGYDYCQTCGKKSLRSAQNEDFCFLVEMCTMYGELFCGVLKEENIPHSTIPWGNGAWSHFGLKLENYRIFVPYKFFDRAKELLNEVFARPEEENNYLKENLDKLFIISPRAQKKMRKNLNLAQNDDLIAYCADKIKNADDIIDKGQITDCLKGGTYLFIYKDNEVFVVNSATYEIISAKRD